MHVTGGLVIAIGLALASSLACGSADFAGGLASRRAHVLRVVTAGAPAGLGLYLLLLPLVGAAWSRSALAWGAGYGLASAVTFALLYETLALGPMSVLAPLTAVISAVVPVGVGLLEGGRLASPAILGLLVVIFEGDLAPARATEPAAPTARRCPRVTSLNPTMSAAIAHMTGSESEAWSTTAAPTTAEPRTHDPARA